MDLEVRDAGPHQGAGVQDHAQLAVAKQHMEVVVDHRTGALRADVRHDRRGQAEQVQRLVDQVSAEVDGELDWLAAGLPTEGRNADRPRAGDVARRDVPTCRLNEPIGEVHKRVGAAGWNACVVVNDQRVVLGLLRAEQLQRGQNEPVEQVMRPGPSTFRPHVPIEELTHFMIPLMPSPEAEHGVDAPVGQPLDQQIGGDPLQDEPPPTAIRDP